MPTRKEMWERLGDGVDLLVIGGGINGVGIARDAIHRGLTVAVVEKGDLAGGTSSRSSKLVHGGLRYLEQLEFSLVFEAVSERKILMDIAPHLVNPLGFLFPVYKGDRRSLATITAGMVLYDGLSLFRSPRLHRRLNPDQVAEEEPALKQEGLRGAPLYYDCSTDDARLTLETALDAVAYGAVVATHAEATSFLHDEQGRIRGAVVRDLLGGEEKEVVAAAVVNATGPWTDRTIALDGHDRPALLRPTKGVHIVLAHHKLPVNNAVVCFHPDDGRVLFAIPWGETTYVGTTDTDHDGDLDSVHATSDDVDYLLRCLELYFPDHPVGREDVVCTWSGLRPLMRSETSDLDESSVSREHRIVVSPDGLVTIAGGKLTTYRLMSHEVVDTVAKMLRLSGALHRRLKESRTDDEPLPGAIHWPEDDDHDAVAARVQAIGGQLLSAETSRALACQYGTLGQEVARLVREQPELAEGLVPGRPEVLAQVDWAVEKELCASVLGMLQLRMQLYFRDDEQGLTCVERVADRMATLLEWTPEERARQVAEYRAAVDLSRRWRQR
jgi:glycerol-3-phosphate dehydrogenase